MHVHHNIRVSAKWHKKYGSMPPGKEGPDFIPRAVGVRGVDAISLPVAYAKPVAPPPKIDLPKRPRNVKRLTLAAIIKAVCAKRKIPINRVKSRSRQRAATHARQEIYYLAHRFTRMSLLEIGRRMDRDHATVLHGVRQHKARHEAKMREARAR